MCTYPCVCEVHKPVEDSATARSDVHVGQSAEERGSGDSRIGDTPAIAGLEHSGCGTLDGQTVQSTAGDVEERVAGRPGGNENDGVDNGWQGRDSRVSNGDDESRRSGTGTAVRQSGIVARAGDTDGENAEDVEDDQTVEVASRCDGEISTRRLHFSSRDDQQFGSEGEWEDG